MMARFCCIVREEQNSNFQNFMLDYPISLLNVANDFSWDPLKTGHPVLLCGIEQGEIASYQEIDKIDMVRRANAQSHMTVTQNNVLNLADKKFASKTTKSMNCQSYNQGSCVHSKSHDAKGMLYKHICTSCFCYNWQKISSSGSRMQGQAKKKFVKKTRVNMGVDIRTDTHETQNTYHCSRTFYNSS